MIVKNIPPRTVGEGFVEAHAKFSEGDYSVAAIEDLRCQSESITGIYLEHISALGEVIAEGVKSENVDREAIVGAVHVLRELAVLAHVGTETMLKAQAIQRRRDCEPACK